MVAWGDVVERFHDPDRLSWARLGVLLSAVAAAILAVTVAHALVSSWLPPGKTAVDATAACMAIVGLAIMGAGLTRARRFPGESFAAGGLLMFCLAAMTGDDLRTWLSLPAFLLAWGSLAIRLAPDTRISLFLAHLLPLDAVLDDLGLEEGTGNVTGILAALYLLALLFALPVVGPWRTAVAAFAGCAVAAALVIGLGHATAWTWRVGVFFAAVIAYGALVFFAWRARREAPWPMFASQRALAAVPAPVAATPAHRARAGPKAR